MLQEDPGPDLHLPWLLRSANGNASREGKGSCGEAQADAHDASVWFKASAGREGLEQKLPLWPQPPWTGCKIQANILADCKVVLQRERNSKTNLRKAAFS